MEEIEDTGTYTGRYKIPGEINDAQAEITCFLEDLKGNMTSMAAPEPLRIDNLPPVPPKNLVAAILPEKGIGLDWKVVGEKKDIAAFRVYRSSDEKIKIGPEWMIASDLPKDIFEYKDLRIMPGTRYHYVIVSVDEAGNESEPSNEVEVFTIPDKTPPDIIRMQIIGGMGVWKTGDTITLLMVGESGGEARFSIGYNIKDILMQESPGTGKYRGQYVFRDGDEADDMQVIGKLTDTSGNFAIFDPNIRVSVVLVSDGTRPEVYGIEEDSFRIGGDEGLVAGDVLEVTVRGTPGCYGVFHLGALVDEDQNLKIDWSGFRGPEWHDISGYQIHKVAGPPSNLSKDTLIARLGIGQREYRLFDAEIPDKGVDIYLAASDYDGHPQVIFSPKWNIPLVESEEQGVYKGRYIVKPGDRMIHGYSFVSLKDKLGNSSIPFRSPRTIIIDTRSRIEVRPRPPELKAESHSRSLIKITLKDIKGHSVPGRQVGVAIFTTSEYTGLVGLGSINQSDIGHVLNALMGIGAGMDDVEPYIFTTDHYGEIEVDYQAGFAAKTVIFRARDLITGDVEIGYCTSYIEAEAQIEQYNPIRALEQEYPISLSADPNWLTADGISPSTITATVKGELREPLKVYQVYFSIVEGDGRLSPNNETTDEVGKAEVTYIAGKQIGTVRIRARVTIDGEPYFSKEEKIILKSDAPARVSMTVWDIKCENKPYNEKNDKECKIVEIPADGISKCRLKIKVTDINGNPSRGVGLALSLKKGDGKISDPDETTDFKGEGEAIYQSGYAPGDVLFNLRVTSKIPTSEELEEVRWLR
jgi:hypothetical protein